MIFGHSQRSFIMNYSNPTYQKDLFQDFQQIDSTAYREIVDYYDTYKSDLANLELDEFFEVLQSYVNALFQLGKYQKHLKIVDRVVEISIMHNIKYSNDTDILSYFLFQKAAAYFHLFHLDRADHILRELIKMNPKDTLVPSFLKKCLRRKKSGLVATSRALSVFLFFASAIVISLEVLIDK